jgi:hypothetical protein
MRRKHWLCLIGTLTSSFGVTLSWHSPGMDVVAADEAPPVAATAPAQVQQPDPVASTPTLTTNAIGANAVIPGRATGGGSGNGGVGGGSSGDPVTPVSNQPNSPNSGNGRPRVTWVVLSPSTNPCTTADGRPGSVSYPIVPPDQQANPQPSLGAICVATTDPTNPIQYQPWTIAEAAAYITWPRMTANTNPGQYAGLVGVPYALWITGPTTVTDTVTRADGTVGVLTANAYGYRINTNTGSTVPNHETIALSVTRQGTQTRPFGEFVWQTSGTKQIDITTTWAVTFLVTYPNGTTDNLTGIVYVNDTTPYPVYEIITRITHSE